MHVLVNITGEEGIEFTMLCLYKFLFKIIIKKEEEEEEEEERRREKRLCFVVCLFLLVYFTTLVVPTWYLITRSLVCVDECFCTSLLSSGPVLDFYQGHLIRYQAIY